MADKLADLSPEEKEKRIAEMKAKMQAAAAKNKPAGGETPKEAAPAAKAQPTSVSSGEAAIAQAQATAAAAHAVPSEASAAVIEASTHNLGSEHPAPVVPAAEASAAVSAATNGAKVNGAGSNGVGSNGGTAVASAPILVAAPPVFVEETPEQRAKKEMNRREFLTYAWGATLGLIVLQAGVGTFFFMYPRFKEGEFGGKFYLGPVSALPPTDAAPIPETAGKFWLVNTTDEGPKALYMVCTHLGCLYKWAQSNNRFECPCHGSKFSREGFYIEGPASRSLDTFELTEEEGQVVVNTGKRIIGAPAAESPARVVPT
jgi:cytochrome b6-f complex iron-sulfur subunit